MRKGKLQEIVSKALFADNTSDYTVVYREMDMYPEIPLSEFIEKGEIPFSRIVEVRKKGRTIWRKRTGNNFYI